MSNSSTKRSDVLLRKRRIPLRAVPVTGASSVESRRFAENEGWRGRSTDRSVGTSGGSSRSRDDRRAAGGVSLGGKVAEEAEREPRQEAAPRAPEVSGRSH